MATTDTSVNQLIINKLSKSQYENIQNPSDTELYLVPDVNDPAPTSGSDNYLTSGVIYDALQDKADKISGGTSGNFVGLDANGNLVDSGKKPADFADKIHSHGNITNDGTLQTTDVSVANGDKLVITDSSNSNKIARTSVTFDGTTTTKALTPKGTWETFCQNGDGIHIYRNTTGTAAVTSGAYNHAKWNATDTSVSAYTDGLMVNIKVPVAASDSYGTAFRINNLDYKPVVCNLNTGIGTRYSVGSVVIATYNSTQTATMYVSGTSTTITGLWQVMDYNSNDPNYNIRYYAPVYVTEAYPAYCMGFINPETGKLTPFSSGGTSSISGKTMTSEDIEPFSNIVYNASSAVPKNSYAYGYNLYFVYALADSRYSFNGITTSTLSARTAVYLVFDLQPNGKLKFVEPYYTQTLPTTNDGHLYMFLGVAHNGYQVNIYNTHQIYYHDGTQIKEYLGESSLSEYEYDNQEFVYRKTAGGNILFNGNQAQINRVQGNTLAWNQFVFNGDFSEGTNEWTGVRGTISATNGVLTFVGDSTTNNTKFPYNKMFYPVIGHNYLITFYIKTDVSGGTSVVLCNYGLSGQSLWAAINNITTDWSYKTYIWENTDLTQCRLSTRWLSTANEGGSLMLRDFMCIDLTLIYGAGNEPSTPEQFEADYFRWFGKPLTYEPYDAGSLRNVQMQGLKTTGFNQWDEEWEVGQYRNDNGALYVNDYNIRCKNLIPVIGGSSYYGKCPSQLRICTYDSEKNFLGAVQGGFNNNIKTFDNNIAYISICTLLGTSSSAITTYNNDICINISDTNKNGTYEPYEEHNVSVPVTTLTGKVNGQGDSVVIFPDGMKGVGDIKDEIKVENGVTKAIKRIGRVDLGTLTWTFQTTFSVLLTTELNSIGKGVVSPNIANICCAKYCTKSTTTYANMLDKTIQFGGQALAIKDSSYTDAAIFKTAMSGVCLDYELAEPIEYVVDDSVLPANYKVDNYGTEEVLPVPISGITVAPSLDIIYGVNIDQSLDSKEDKSNKVTSILPTSNDIEYPSARAVYNIIKDIDYSRQYFTTEALDSGVISFFIAYGIDTNLLQSMSYSLDDGKTWTTVNNEHNKAHSISIDVNVSEGDKVLWKGYGIALCDGNDEICSFECEIGINVYGNIMSLLYGDDFVGKTELPNASYNFYELFSYDVNNGANVVSAKNLILPATILTQGCYSYMFYGCTGLIYCPELPATTLSNYCYDRMFCDCTSLTESPELPAITLSVNCYCEMFAGCASLKQAPELQARNLASGCYEGMFLNCALTTAPELPATRLYDSCYQVMFQGCRSLRVAPKLPAINLADDCYHSMFYNCTSLIEAPELPALVLRDSSYQNMFQGCTSLNYIKCLATDISASYCTYNWVNNVSSAGTFIKADNMTSWTRDNNGIPVAWNAYTESEWKEVKHYELADVSFTADYDDLDNTPDILYKKIAKKEYSPYTCSANTMGAATIFFLNVIPTSDNWYMPWNIKYRIYVTTSEQYTQGVYDCMFGSVGTSSLYSIFNSVYSSSYPPFYNHTMLWHNTSAKYANRNENPIKIGERIYSSRLVTSLARNIKVEVYEAINCTFELLENFELYADVYTDAKYGNVTQVSSYSNGLQETGDNTYPNYYNYEYYQSFKIHGENTPLYRYKLCGFDVYGRLVPITSTNQTDATMVTKTPNIIPMDLSRGIVYYGSSTAITDPNTLLGTGVLYRNRSDITSTLYTYNFNTNPEYKDNVYLVGDYKGGLFTLDNSSTNSYYLYTQNIGTGQELLSGFTEGKYYVYIGNVDNNRYMNLLLDNPIYYFNGTSLVPIDAKKADKPLVINVSVGDTDVPTGTFSSIENAFNEGREVIVNINYMGILLETRKISNVDALFIIFSNSGIVYENLPPMIGYCIIRNDDTISLSFITVEDKANKVTSLSSSSTNDEYPSAKCVYDSLENKGSGIHVYRDVSGTTAVTSSPYHCAKYDVTDTRVTEYVDGMIVNIKVPVAGNGSYGTGFQINNLGYKPIVYGTNSMISTRYPVDGVIIATYNSTITGRLYLGNGAETITGCWQVMDYDLNYYNFNIRHYNSIATKSLIKPYVICFLEPIEMTYIPINSTGTTGASGKTMYDGEFNPFTEIVFNNYSSDVASGSTITGSYLYTLYHAVDVRYSFNGITSSTPNNTTTFNLTVRKPFYIICDPLENGNVKLATETPNHNFPWTQDLPNTSDGKLYIYLGMAYSKYQIELYNVHPIYYHDGTQLRIYTGSENMTPLIDASSVSSPVTIDPYKMYDFGNLSTSLTVSFNTSSVFGGYCSEYTFKFTAKSGCSITLPSGVKVSGGSLPTYVADRVYQFKIVDNLCVVSEFY